MTAPEGLLRYRDAAAQAGVEVDFVPNGLLLDRLWMLLAAESCKSAAVPPSGWSEGTRETVVGILEAFGCRVIAPRSHGTGFAWERSELPDAALGITYCPHFLARTGTLVFPAGPGMGTLASLLPPVHLALSLPDGLHEDLSQCLQSLSGGLPSRLTLVTGPSRTGDIEATVTEGVHGPRRVLHWILSK